MTFLGKIWNWGEGLLRKIVSWFLGLFHREITDEQWQSFMQFVKFALVGCSNTVVTYVVYVLGVAAGLHYQFSNLLGYALGILNSFFWNNRFVFKRRAGEQRNLLAALGKVYVSYAFSYVVSAVLLFVWIDLLNVPEFFGPLITTAVTTPINFLLNKLWAFRSRKK